MLLEGKVAIVSGIGPGLGRAIALCFAREGAELALAARRRESLEAVAAEVEALGRRVVIVPTDISQAEQTKNLAECTFQHFGRVDILVNNAFQDSPHVEVAAMTDADVEGWRRSIEVNLVGTMLMCRAVAPYMIAAGRGTIVNITSISMRVAKPRRSGYAASKAGITLLSQVLATELGPHGIRVNCVAPGHIWADNLRRFYEEQARLNGRTYEEQYAQYTSEMALRKVPEAEQIAASVLYMASDLASVVTGQTLDVNGGHFFH
jgi:NAD(P)-dependent dehydrogenase (short-subunit alcohol dehydrogenase family)